MESNPPQLIVHVSITLLFLLFVSVLAADQGGSSSIKTDVEALLAFRKMIQKDPSGVFSGWQLNRNPCSWYGVTCTLGRATQLDLGKCNLVGTISFAPLASLNMLTLLNLSANSFIVNSSSLLQLPFGLEQLELSSTGLAGLVPDNFLTKFPNLVYANLSNNTLTGLLPENLLLNSNKLQLLDLSLNNITGSISGLKIETCDSLLHLDLSKNKIIDSIPFSLSNCTNLKSLIFHTICSLGPYRSLLVISTAYRGLIFLTIISQAGSHPSWVIHVNRF